MGSAGTARKMMAATPRSNGPYGATTGSHLSIIGLAGRLWRKPIKVRNLPKNQTGSQAAAIAGLAFAEKNTAWLIIAFSKSGR